MASVRQPEDQQGTSAVLTSGSRKPVDDNHVLTPRSRYSTQTESGGNRHAVLPSGTRHPYPVDWDPVNREVSAFEKTMAVIRRRDIIARNLSIERCFQKYRVNFVKPNPLLLLADRKIDVS